MASERSSVGSTAVGFGDEKSSSASTFLEEPLERSSAASTFRDEDLERSSAASTFWDASFARADLGSTFFDFPPRVASITSSPTESVVVIEPALCGPGSPKVDHDQSAEEESIQSWELSSSHRSSLEELSLLSIHDAGSEVTEDLSAVTAVNVETSATASAELEQTEARTVGESIAVLPIANETRAEAFAQSTLERTRPDASADLDQDDQDNCDYIERSPSIESVQFIESTQLDDSEREMRFGPIRKKLPPRTRPRRFFKTGPLAVKVDRYFKSDRTSRRRKEKLNRYRLAKNRSTAPLVFADDVFTFRGDAEMLIVSMPSKKKRRGPIYAGAWRMLQEVFSVTFCGPPPLLNRSKKTGKRRM